MSNGRAILWIAAAIAVAIAALMIIASTEACSYPWQACRDPQPTQEVPNGGSRPFGTVTHHA